MLSGTQNRKHQLATTKFITCTCSRCSDPTELGTNFSSLKCIGADDGEACDGVQVPMTNEATKELEWTCDKCPARVSASEVADLMGKMGDEIDGTMANEATVPALEALLGKLSNFLHPNHFHMFTLKHALAQLYGNHRDYAFDSLDVGSLERKIRFCDETLAVVEKLDPGCVRLGVYAAVILYEKCNGMRELMKRKVKGGGGGGYGKVDGLKLLQRAQMAVKSELDTVQGKNLSGKIGEAIEMWQQGVEG
jgi:hypothetical protein